jgi:hypothetical protein
MAKQDNKFIFSEWLEKLQQESWQLELLISGLALFGIYESQYLLVEINMYVLGNSDGIARVTQSFFVRILEVGWKIFFINLLIHVILRGLWIGTIGLRYVSNDIDYQALRYSTYFTEMLKRKVGTFDDFIERLEKICSVLFAYTFLLFLLFFSLGFFIFQIVLISYLISNLPQDSVASASIILVLYVLLGLIVFVDFITLGVLKKIEEKSVNKIYGFIFIFYGWTTLTFLYRPILYNFLDNRYTRRLFFFSIPYILLILLSSQMFSNNNFIFYPPSSNALQFGNTLDKMFYEDLRKEYMTEVDAQISKRRRTIPNIVLNKYLNDEDYLKIFLKMDPSDYVQIQNNADLDPYWKGGFNFTLFTSERYKDKFYKKGNDLLESEFDTLRTTRQDLRRQKRATEDTIQIKKIDAQIEEISSYINNKREKFKEEGIVFEENKQKRTIEAFLDIIDLDINDTNAKNNLDCYFFQHSNNNEKGLLCLYPMDSLSLGRHTLHFYKEIERDSGKKNKIVNIKIPFYKVKKNSND